MSIAVKAFFDVPALSTRVNLFFSPVLGYRDVTENMELLGAFKLNCFDFFLPCWQSCVIHSFYETSSFLNLMVPWCSPLKLSLWCASTSIPSLNICFMVCPAVCASSNASPWLKWLYIRFYSPFLSETLVNWSKRIGRLQHAVLQLWPSHNNLFFSPVWRSGVRTWDPRSRDWISSIARVLSPEWVHRNGNWPHLNTGPSCAVQGHHRWIGETLPADAATAARWDPYKSLQANLGCYWLQQHDEHARTCKKTWFQII